MSAQARVAAVEDALVRLLMDAEARTHLDRVAPPGLAADLADPHRADLHALGREVVKRLVAHTNRGVGTLASAYPEVFAGWTASHPEDPDGHALVAAFAASPAARAWRPVAHAGLGPPLETCFADFASGLPGMDVAVLQRRHALAVGRALTVDPDPLFVVPPPFVGEPGRRVAVLPGVEPFLVAALRTRLLSGPITPLVAALVLGESDAQILARLPGTAEGVARARVAVAEMGLVTSA